MLFHIEYKCNVYLTIFLLLLTAISAYGQNTEPHFVDIALNYGIDHQYAGAGTGGISFVDFNQDGLDDLTLSSSKGNLIQFYINTGNGFEQTPPIIPYTDEVKQIIWVDFDNDGDLDLYYCTYDAINRLFRNDGFPILTDITLSAQLPTYTNRSHGALWSDINRDGWLDLYFTNRKLPVFQPENTNSLFLNNQDGTFTDLSEYSNSQDIGKLPFCAGVIDYNNDKWPDLYVANDRANGNAFFKNNRDSTFTEVSEVTHTSFDIDAMTVTVGDINNDQLQDFYLTNLPDEGNKLLINQGYQADSDEFVFLEEAQQRGVDFHQMSWAANFLDVNLDGWLDLYVSSVTSESQGQRLLTNTGEGYFINGNYGFAGDSLISNCNALGDLDNNGRMEIAVMNNFGPFQLWQDVNENDQHWISISLEGHRSNFNGVGSTIKVFTEDLVQSKHTTCGTSFLSQNSFVNSFGIREFNNIDSIIVEWPSGHLDKLYNVDSDQKINILEGSTTNGNIMVDEEIEHLYPIINNGFFKESHSSLGIHHIHKHQQFLGGGAAIFDYDNDGDSDIYLTGGSEMDKLYSNEGNGEFTDVSMDAGLLVTSFYFTNGVMFGDVDNDGYKDIFVTTTGNVQQLFGKNLLLHNQGNGQFIEKWTLSGPKDNTAALGSTFIDFDQDGLLDIYVVSYVEESAFLYDENNAIIGFDHNCFENRLYKNMGAPESFIDFTDSISLYDDGCSLATTASDMDMDGFLDLLTANDFGEWITPNTLQQYDTTNHTFNEISEEKRFNSKMYGMGIGVSDFDNDLDFDYYITNIGKNVFLKNNIDTFENISDIANVGNEWIIPDSISSVSWGASFLDYDNDRYEDLYVANGYVPTPSFLNTTLFNPDVLYQNNGTGSFTQIDSTDSGIDNRLSARGSAVGDLDNDGDLDLISAVISVPQNLNTWNTLVYINEHDNENHWVQFDLEGVLANRDGLGSKIMVYTPEGAMLKEISGSSSHCSHDSDIAHFGLGEATIIDSVHIDWPSRSSLQRLYDIDIDQRHAILEDTTGTSMTMDTMTIDTTTATNNFYINEINIRPNPSYGGQITIESTEDIEILRLLSVDGNSIPYNVIESGNKFILDINPSNYSTGLYFLEVRNNKHIYYKRIVIIPTD